MSCLAMISGKEGGTMAQGAWTKKTFNTGEVALSYLVGPPNGSLGVLLAPSPCGRGLV